MGIAQGQGQSGGIEDIKPGGIGFDVSGDINMPINGQDTRAHSGAVYDKSTEWVGKVQPTAKGLRLAYVGATAALAKLSYQLRVSGKNGVLGGSTVSGRPPAIWGAVEGAPKTVTPNIKFFRIIPVVGCSFTLKGDKGAYSLVRSCEIEANPLETQFSLSRGRLHEDTQNSDSQTAAGVDQKEFPIPAYATHATVWGFSKANISDFFYRDPAGNLFGVGFGAETGIKTKFGLHPLALSLIVATTGAAEMYIEWQTLE